MTKRHIALLLAIVLTISSIITVTMSVAADINPDNYSVPTNSVRQGTKGNDAFWVQSVLSKLGYEIDVDGSIGPKSVAKIKLFQSRNGLTADGSVGPATRAKMVEKWEAYKAYPSSPTATADTSSPSPTAPAQPTPDKTDPDSYTVPVNSVRIGTSGNDAFWVQAILVKIGYNIAIDGGFGAKTAEAVKQYQRENGLDVDGNVGAVTRASLKKAWEDIKEGKPVATPVPTPVPTPTPMVLEHNPDYYSVPTKSVAKGSSGNDVYWVQSVLYTLGYNITVDGGFGAKTESVVKTFQDLNELEIDGKVGPMTCAEMNAQWQKFKKEHNVQTPEFGVVTAKPRVSSSFFDSAIFIGDSITYKLELYEKSKNKLGNCAFSTWPAQGIREVMKGSKLIDAIKASGKTRIYIMFGFNDIRVSGNEGAANNMETICKRIQSAIPGAKIYIESMTTTTHGSNIAGSFRPDRVHAYNNLLKEKCIKNHWYYIDLTSALEDGEGYLKNQYCSEVNGMGIHFSGTGCDAWIDYLYTHTAG